MVYQPPMFQAVTAVQTAEMASRNQRTPSHAKGTRARLTRVDRVTPNFPKNLPTTSLPQPETGQSLVFALIAFLLLLEVHDPQMWIH